MNMIDASLRCRLLIAALLLPAGCATTEAVGKTQESLQPSWSYGGATGPEHWGALDPAYSACALGRAQSPVEISEQATGTPVPIQFEYRPTAGEAINNGHSIQVNMPSGNRITQGERTYELVQFHFHAAAEHHIDAHVSPMELHLVHRSDDGSLAVVGVLIERGDQNAALEPLFARLPAVEGRTAAVPPIDIEALLPADRRHAEYMGSLTTPPCTEGVRWNVLRTPIQLSPEQIEAYLRLYDHTARPLEPLNGRRIEG